MSRDLKIFVFSLFLIPLIPSFILHKKGFVNYGYIVLVLFWLAGITCVYNKNFAHNFKTFLDKILGLFGKYLAIIILFFGYIFVVIPTSLIMKITKRDRLRLSKQNTFSYWVDVNNTQADYERQF